jgi:hypothetical protein
VIKGLNPASAWCKETQAEIKVKNNEFGYTLLHYLTLPWMFNKLATAMRGQQQ